MYTFKVNIDKKEHDTFVEAHPLCNLLQSSSWAKVKENWDNKIVGVYDGTTLVASSLVLIKKLPMNFTMMYIPRGPIMDYTNDRLVTYFFSELRKWAKAYHCLFIKMDPGIHINDYKIDEQNTNYYPICQTVINNMKKAGCNHQGFTTYIEESIQPRFHMGVKKCDSMDDHIPRATLRSKNVALRKHVKVKIYGKEGLPEFAKVMHMTEERKSVQLRNEEYFNQLMDAYPDTSYLFLASANPMDRKVELETIIKNAEAELNRDDLGNKAKKKVTQELQQANQELDSMQEIISKYDHEEVIGGGLMIGFGNTVEMLYAGMNEDFRTFRPQYLTYITQFEYAFNHGYDYVTMGGVEGTLDDGLSVYKSNFNPIVNEFIGEFDLPVNGLLYKMSEVAYKIRKKRNKKK